MRRLKRYEAKLGKSETENRRELELAEVINSLLESAMYQARVDVFELENGVTRVAHGLGRIPQGFFAISHTASVDIIDDRDTNPHTDRWLFVRADAATNATLLIF